MMRCFSVCARSHDGHLYVISSYWKPYSAAKCGMNSYEHCQRLYTKRNMHADSKRTKKSGDKKFSMNQNLTLLFV